MVNEPTVISTFAGCGGSSLGYQMAGFRELLAVEWDTAAAATFKLNFPDVPVYQGDIRELTAEKCLELASIEPGELDVLDGSPPCQGFSTAGKRRYTDPRNDLAFEFIRLIDGLKPKAFVMENVTGLIKGVMKRTYLAITKAMRDCGYAVKGQVLNAMWYGVPQSRERVIVVGVREDLGVEPGHPKPEVEPPRLRTALANVTPVTFTGDDVRKNHGYRSALRRNRWDGIACTLSGSMNRHGVHPKENRYFSIEEMARLAAYPDSFRWAGSAYDRVRQIGNSVPPLMMKSIAEHLRDHVLRSVVKAGAA